MLIGTNRGARGQHLRIEDVFIRAGRDSGGIRAIHFFNGERHEIASERCVLSSFRHPSFSVRSSSSFVLCQVHRRGPVIMNDAICVRDITREPLAAATCISGSRCVTRLIKIPRDLLRRGGIAAGGRSPRSGSGDGGEGERGREGKRVARVEDEGGERERDRGAGGEKGKERKKDRKGEVGRECGHMRKRGSAHQRGQGTERRVSWGLGVGRAHARHTLRPR